MHARRIVLLALVVWGCGSSGKSGNLFTASKCSQGAVAACVGENDCTGQAVCGADGQMGPCACTQPPEAGGASGAGGSGGLLGSGGVGPFGGNGGISGFPSTGGFFPIGTGGFAGVPDGSTGTGGMGGVTTCPSGSYSGTYMGTYGLTQSQVKGNIDFTMDASGNVTGRYMGTTPNNGSKADLNGTFDCTTLALSMRVENGTYPGIIGNVHFTGTMPGTYSSETRSFSGTWNISDDNSQSGSGTWTAN